MFRAVHLAALALSLVLAVPGMAEAKKVTLTYVGYLAGLPVLDLLATIDLAEVATPAKGAYRITAEIATKGDLARLYPFRQSMETVGRFMAGLPSPQSHRVGQTIWNQTRSVTLRYVSDGTVRVLADPPTLQAARAAREGYANNTLDPASALVALALLFAERKSCAATVAVFDGARRFDLALTQGALSDLGGLERSYYVGWAAECRVTPSLKGGFQEAAIAANLYPRSARLWLAAAIPDFPGVPVRIVTRNAFGEMMLDLVGARTE